MDKKYQIFVSSTYNDLVEERQQVMRAILNMGHIPIGMEQFKAGDEAQWKVIQRHIDASDYYIIIVAHRYGSTIPRSGISYTEKEYDYAVKQGVPVLGFVIDKGIAWPPQHIEADQQKKDRLEKFKSKVMKKPVQFWKSADDLFGKVAIALPETITIQPRTGWVRSNSEIGPEVVEEIARLSKENSELKVKLDEIKPNYNSIPISDILNGKSLSVRLQSQVNNENLGVKIPVAILAMAASKTDSVQAFKTMLENYLSESDIDYFKNNNIRIESHDLIRLISELSESGILSLNKHGMIESNQPVNLLNHLSLIDLKNFKPKIIKIQRFGVV